MKGRAVANELAKMRHLRVGVIATVTTVAVLALTVLGIASGPEIEPDSAGSWQALLAGLSMAVPLVMPLLLAVLASRQTDIEHHSGGWLWQAATGLRLGTVCRAKAASLGLVVTAVTIAASLTALAVGALIAGITAPVPIRHWVGFTVCVLVVNLTLLALYLVVSALVENQLVTLALGVLGTLLAVFSQGLPTAMSHMTPWGYYALARAAGYRNDDITSLPISYPSIAALAVVATALFAFATHRLDRQEV